MQPLDDGGYEVGVLCGADQTDDVFGLLQALCCGLDNLVDAVKRDQLRVDRGTRDAAVLAEDALQVAVGKEYVAYAAPARYGRLFAGMGVDGGDFGAGRIAAAEPRQGFALAWTFMARHFLELKIINN